MIQDFPDDEFIAEAQRRVRSGRYSPDAYMSPHQSDDRAKLGILRKMIVDLAIKLDELDAIRGNPLPERAYAINTTLVGKDDINQDHSPKEETK